MVGCIRVAARTNRKGTGECTKAHLSTAFQNPDARRHSRHLQLVYWDRLKHYSNIQFNYKLKDFNSVWIIRASTITTFRRSYTILFLSNQTADVIDQSATSVFSLIVNYKVQLFVDKI